MYARVARYRIDPDRCDDAVESFREAGAQLAALDGFAHGYVLIDSDGGGVMTVTIWESQRALEASEMRATSVRQAAARAVDGDVESVLRFDVTHELRP